MKKIGYFCSPNDSTDTIEKKNRLKQAGCSIIYKDNVQSTREKRPALTRLCHLIESKDELIVCSLHDLGFSLTQLIETLDDIHHCGASLTSLDDHLKSTELYSLVLFQEWRKSLRQIRK